jgi:hypothetical protein
VRPPYLAIFISGVVVSSFTAANADAADPAKVASQERLQAKGWLQLERDQETFRKGVEPLGSRESSKLDNLEQRQRGRARELELRQRQSLNSERNRQRRDGVPKPARQPHDLKARRQLDRQRLEMRIQRETLRPGLR